MLDWLRLARHQAVDSYLPDSDTVRDSCLEDVAACDLYVLIAGHRYGFQPPEDNPEGLSITHLEFRRAGEVRDSAGGAAAHQRSGCARCRICWIRRGRRWWPGSGRRWPREVRAAEFSDLQGLIQGLSTGVQGELAKLAKRDRGPGWPGGGPGAAAGAAAGVPGGAGGAAGGAGCPAGRDGAGRGRGWWCCAGWAARARPAWRWSTRTGTWPRWGCAGSSRRRIRRCWRRSSRVLAAQLGAREAGGCRGIRWRRCTRCWPGPRPGGCWCSITRPDRASVERFVPPAGRGPGADHHARTSTGRPARRVDVPVLDTEVAAGFLVNRTGDADRAAAAGAGRGAGRAAAGAGAGRRLHAGHRDHPGPVPAVVPGPAGGPAGPRRGRRAPGGRGRHAGPGAVPAGRRGPGRGGAAAAAGVPGPRAGAAGPAARRAQAAGRLDPAVAATVGPLLGDPVAAGDAVAALRRYSLVTPAGDGLVLVHRLVQAITRAQLPAEAGRPVGAGRRGPGRGGGPRRPATACGVAGVRGAAAARPGCP